MKYPRVVLCLAGVIFKREDFKQFTQNALQLFSKVCYSLNFAEWKRWANNAFAKQIREGRQLEGLRLRLSQFVQNDILLSGEGLLPLFADSALVSFPVRS
ncbi:hypothetical protein EAH_00014560 [Eimeria acervulina]|uniref:Uncharacterized protein n=1 Tax=Eimeria acervulina TaxID=5801 RepID=U6GL84_EIMAC|nr:hypothetical protein EAH_00014560 [Eimeria acervulina]CDI80342.1 hypothetical protein EAH_00014560 [Eimeria acervulina]